VRDRIVKSLSGLESVHRLFGTLNSYFGIEFEFVGLGFRNVGLKMFRTDNGEKIPVFFVNSYNMEDVARRRATDPAAYFMHAYEFGHIYDGESLSTFGQNAARAAENLLLSMKLGGVLFNGWLVLLGNVPPFSSLKELEMKLELAGVEKERGREV